MWNSGFIDIMRTKLNRSIIFKGKPHLEALCDLFIGECLGEYKIIVKKKRFEVAL